MNVVENALKFSPADRPVDVLVSPSGAVVEIAVSGDAGEVTAGLMDAAGYQALVDAG